MNPDAERILTMEDDEPSEPAAEPSRKFDICSLIISFILLSPLFIKLLIFLTEGIKRFKWLSKLLYKKLFNFEILKNFYQLLSILEKLKSNFYQEI